MKVPGVLQMLGDLVYPRVCRCCGELLAPGSKVICPACHLKLIPTNFYEGANTEGFKERISSDLDLGFCWSLYFYSPQTLIARLVGDFKYRHMPSVARNFGVEMGRKLRQLQLLSDVDMLIPISLHWTKQVLRGYNQAEQLARGISAETGIPIGRNLYAKRGHATQTRKTRDERQQNLSGVFGVRNGAELEGKHVLLIDDICTTGSTLTAAARALEEGAPKWRREVPSVRISAATLGCALS